MDVCSWDWGAIGSFVGAGATLIGAVIASRVAWCISKQWKDQKGSEVIANETKELIKDITQSISLLGNIIYDDTNSTIKNENIISNFLNIKRLDLEIHRKIYFIENTIIFYNLDKIYKDFNILNSSIIDSLGYRIDNNDFKEYERYRPLLEEKYIKLCDLSDNLIIKLSPLSLYREEIKFKEPPKSV